jgi:peptidoglycan/LPS O-acetylase OafA/YrhL
MATFTECIPEAAAIQQGKYAAYEGKSPLPPKGNGVRRTFYVPELDALRFCAFLMVFFRHITSQFGAIRSYAAGPSVAVMKSGLAPVSESTGHWAVIQGFTQSMDFGVCLFFFLSSFLITRLLLLERQAAGRIDVGKFYVRRSLRIWPLYFVFLATVAVLAHWVTILQCDRLRLLSSALFVANWAAVLHGWASVSIQPLWSVSVEEQFYAVWPWLVRGGRTMILKVSGGLFLVSLATLIYLGSRTGLQVTAVWPNTLVQMMFFAGGACTAVLSKPETRHLRMRLRLCLIAGGLLSWIVASAGLHLVRTNSPGTFSLLAGYLLVLAGTYLIFIGVAGWDATRIPRVTTYLGRISYGLYVFHMVALLLVEQLVLPHLLPHLAGGTKSLLLAESLLAILGFVLTLVCAMVSYKFLEKPFLKFSKHFAVISSRPA